MDNFLNQQKELFFSENIIQVLFDILKKYKLLETEEEFLKKLEKNQPFSGEIITGLAKDLFRGTIKETELVSLLKDKLNIQKETAETLATDIKQQFLPLLKEEIIIIEEPAIEKIVQTNDEDTTSIIKKPSVVSVEENEKILKTARESTKESTINNVPADIETLKAAPRRIKKTTPLNTIEQTPTQPKQSKGSDKYREPIE